MKQVSVEIVKRSDAAKAFVVLPKRWIVERTIAWLNRCRRLAKDWECLNRNALASLGLHPAYDPKALQENKMISDRL
jgi:transposase